MCVYIRNELININKIIIGRHIIYEYDYEVTSSHVVLIGGGEGERELLGRDQLFSPYRLSIVLINPSVIVDLYLTFIICRAYPTKDRSCGARLNRATCSVRSSTAT